MKISTIIELIDLGSIALPKFQRGYVWNRDQVRGLMYSLYRKHPVGSLLVWETRTESADARGDGHLAPGIVKLLLDGQQRITSLYGIIRGRPPKFFDGNPLTFKDLCFNLEDETFEFYAPLKMKDNPLWINVTELMKTGPGTFIGKLYANPTLHSNLDTYIGRITAIYQINDIDLHIENVTGEDKTIDVVVEIFNRVNSGGTKLSKGDLALAKICAGWPNARDEMKARLEKWRKAGFNFELDWLLRTINTILTGDALFSALKNVDTPTFQKGLRQAENAIDLLLNLIAGRLGLDHDRVLGSRYSFPLLARYLVQRGGRLSDHKERDRLLYWYIHTFLWGRYAVSTDTVLNQDLRVIQGSGDVLADLIGQLRQNRGDLRIHADDFSGWSLSARFYPLLYILTRVWHSRDWDTGVELSNHLLGYMNSLELHHIFPKALLYKYGYTRSEVNALANFTFLTRQTNLLVSDRNPSDYLEEFATKQPEALESTWIPMDRDLWKVENYREFLAARRQLLAKAANDFLDSLSSGIVPESEITESILDRTVDAVPGGAHSAEERKILQETNEWIVAQGLPEGEYLYELSDPGTGMPIAVLDLAWPSGLQVGLSQPVALILDDEQEAVEAANRAGYRFFTDVTAFRAYVLRDILALEFVEAVA